ncbi:MAG: DUF3489 domain-containing protein [Alphaproteobacteria bacterium]
MSKPNGAKTRKTRKSAKPRPVTKSDKIIQLLKRQSGATIAELQKTTGWQAHSVRGFLSGTVKKKLGYNVVSEPDAKKQRRYRVANTDPT